MEDNVFATDRFSDVDGRPLQPNSLVGSFFHSDAARGWQGRVLAEVAPEAYLVETFSWAGGDSFAQRLVRLSDMMEWRFYDDGGSMKERAVAVEMEWARERGVLVDGGTFALGEKPS